MPTSTSNVYMALACLGFLNLATAASVPSNTHDVLVTLDKGQQLRGVKVNLGTGEAVNKFYAIPYAKPPTGQLRFEPPAAALEWTGVKDAKTPGTICHQKPRAHMEHARSEDCLNLSVFSPNLNTSHPVLVWIHGGGFHEGSQYGDGSGATLTRFGLVVIMINYRLSPFGFLSTGDDVMPGNYGMLDQVMALKWVRKYIHFFGGDPAQVTIAGESAGSHSVAFQILSPLSKGLFHRAIMESGSSLSSSACEKPGTLVKVKDFTRAIATSIGCGTANSSALLHCLKLVDAGRLLNASDAAEQKFGISFIGIPRVERKFGFLPDHPKNMISSGHFNNVDTLRGFNTGEWAFVIHDTANDGVTRQEFTRYFREYFRKSSFVNDDAIERLVERAYLVNETDPVKIRKSLVDALADLTYGGAALLELEKTAEAAGLTTQHYFYEFSYRANNTATPQWMGVAHAAERQFVFFDPTSAARTNTDKAVGAEVQRMWTNFVKFGNPTPTGSGDGAAHWDRFTPTNKAMMLIGAHPVLEKVPRPFVIPLYEQVLHLMHEVNAVTTDPVIG
ncbi:unnamed protein product [Lymnaea stagnalis]|uniref:Carboxylic ester hydrolase n=1 Tax=Lymnaea stagnalis TaxID=6523 RepID=A0AAV2IQ85_LYMST